MDRKAEWRGLKRMSCLMAAFADGKVTNAEVDACKKKVVDTKLLIIKYPKIPPLAKCATPQLYPSTGAYKRAEYAPLPSLAKGLRSVECSGVQEISRKPAAGSPKSCKCSRVTLSGFYSAGPMVACKNCKDVRRSRDKNSCPKGTKVFSPASRADWKTFITSAGPLRAPHWIIDVTRPQNSCGGCTRHAMNSGNNKQKSWRTSDGSPWWLRSTRYNEPNGDYSANCFLDLWHKPRNENSVTFNDGRCNYHAKSYYCQPIDLSMKPAKGSPASCKCKKVELTSGYSAGMLVRCDQCITVYRSSQRHSCPTGMKIFSPRTRRDWKTFISSTPPLRAPHFIIDVTRPQNGCGGCTRYAMKSTTPQQATWRTSDRSPWWLRSTRYNEPNGDYSANCFLDLWRTPHNSENNIVFNDGRCNYHARSYYCQLQKMDLMPKSGSPKSCKCRLLTLSGAYSAGKLVKCEQCLTVYKSNQKNSCPKGTKIFSPRTRQDWRTFIASAKPLRSPNFIIDVTRPQNGCGGCTRKAMNSKSPSQATWRTSDGSPWWLRSTKYTEPNGDYFANCYMDLWHNTATENSVAFNDKKCAYHSNAYYCQQAVVRKKRRKN
jgi:hypothetical protein